MSARRQAPWALALTLAAGACDLEEVTLAEPDRLVVAEAWVRLGSGLPTPWEPLPSVVTVFLHETLGPDGTSGPVPGAEVEVTRLRDGASVRLRGLLSSLATCVIALPVGSAGTCYTAAADDPVVGSLAPGDRLALRISLPGGGVMESGATIPGAFDFVGVREGELCVLPPAGATGITWSRSEGAWGYVSDTFVSGLGELFGPAVVDDPLYLLGLSVSAADTTIVFPREFGLFARADLDQRVALALQEGLPAGTEAVVTVAAVERNGVNWLRGGSFNPSGQVRLPSVRGDGTGVFGAVVMRSFRVVAGARPDGGEWQAPECPPAG